MNNIGSVIAKMKADYETAKQTSSTGNYWRLSTTLAEAEGELREHIQQITAAQITQIVNKLQNKTPLSPEELDFVKLWLVGDAEYYAKLENNYGDWLVEIDRLMGEYEGFSSKEMNYEESSKLRAMLLDGIRVLGDIVFFLKQKERIANFTESTKELDNEERDLLIRLLRGKLISPNE